MKAIKILFIVFLLFSNTFYVLGQRTIKGRLIDYNLDVLPKASIYNEDSLYLGTTDIEGFFEVIAPEKTSSLVFGFIGYESTTVSFPTGCDYLEVILLPHVRYHYKSNSKVDRLRKKEFNKIPDHHSKAVNKGLFETDNPCYNREFVPIKQRLDVIGKQLKTKRKAIKKDFEELAIGDTIQIPYSVSYRYDGTDRTSLFPFSNVVDGRDFDCIIKGVVVDKNRLNRGYNVEYKVIDTTMCKYDTIIYESKQMPVGEAFTHNMKYFKVILE